ncbi:hypothetical protein ACRE_054000 [Hapsidospora chrysogenum ATCC 11550]|uniref:Uncharacterized protein n=1 Tax=Hapsidospora chrysogenum (strain ATCC 11550 / CBS 779.69 / DSM 880 / IAM 14645 / JCM 23072 / IMI 49137) TaxID=857340 RepID=A0A086T396_HAPC1|nr:hypothetical protein ACRE_054000 [Hapsidospora chrysogenum ATCC 11550]
MPIRTLCKWRVACMTPLFFSANVFYSYVRHARPRGHSRDVFFAGYIAVHPPNESNTRRDHLPAADDTGLADNGNNAILVENCYSPVIRDGVINGGGKER